MSKDDQNTVNLQSPQPEDIVHSSRNRPTVVRVGRENILNRVFTLNNGVVKIHSGHSSSSLSSRTNTWSI
ncbi:hypothetical protein J6590_075294 [Homalodisca vitripennis]|nr:hypothetical protein J6590_075294 [Homalodisca vitripennis]